MFRRISNSQRGWLAGRSNPRAAAVLAAFATLASPVAASAQTLLAPAPTPVPVGSLPSHDELAPIAQPQPAHKRRVTVEGNVEWAPCALDNPAYANIKITLTAANFHNLGPVDPAIMREAYAPYLGQEHGISELCRIRDAAATRLRAMGYIAAVQVPTQRIKDGAVTFEVLYAKLTAIRVVGDAGPDRKLLEAYLSHMVNGKLFNRFEAERYLLLARDIPGYDVRLALKPASTGAGDMIGEITLERTPITADFSTQNYAAHTTGPVGGQLRAVFNGLTGMGDQTVISAYTTADFGEQQIYQLGHTMLLGGDGLKLGGRITYALTRPSLGAGIPDVFARTFYANLELGYPVLRKQAATLRAAGGLDYVNQHVDFAGAPLSEDHLRVAYLRLDGDALDLRGIGPKHSVGWRASGSLEFRQGVDILGASPNCADVPLVCAATGFVAPSLVTGNPTASVMRASANLEVRPVDRLTLGFSPRAQWSSAPLFAFEQMTAGNYTIGRGFDPGAATGDKGIGFQLELRLDAFKLSGKSAFSFQPYVFSDNLWLGHNGVNAAPGAAVHSLGAGLTSLWSDKARFDLNVAAPVSTLPGEASRRDPRVLFSVTTNMLPWRPR